MDTRLSILKPLMTAFGFAVGLSVFLGFAAAPPGVAVAPSDWLTWGYDQERTGWNRSETVLTKDNVSQLKLKWTTLLSTPPREMVLSTLTAPLVATVNGSTASLISRNPSLSAATSTSVRGTGDSMLSA